MKGRIFTPEFKLNVVKAVLSGEKKVVELCRELSVSDNTIHNWKKLYLERGEAAFTPSYKYGQAGEVRAKPRRRRNQSLAPESS